MYQFSKLFFTTLTALLFSCANIEESSKVTTASTTSAGNIIAGVGDIAYKVIKQEDMPNAFGRADVFGRKINTGTTSLIYLGVTDNYATFLRRDVDISSSKTTMNSSPTVINPSSTSYYSGQVGGTSYSGTTTNYSAPIFLPPNTPNDQITGIREMEIKIAISGENNTALISGKILKIISADNNKVVFVLSNP